MLVHGMVGDMEKILDFYKSINTDVFISKSRTLKSACFLSLIGFFIGRVALFGLMNPLMIAFLANFIGTKHKTHLMAIPIAIGVITRFEGLLMLKSLSAVVLVVLSHMLLSLMQIKPGKMTIRIVAGFSALISGLLFALLFGGGPYFIFMAVGGCIFTAALTTIMKEGTTFLGEQYKTTVIRRENAISLLVILSASVAGAADIYIGYFSLKYVLCSFIVLICAKRGGAPIGAMCGVLLGFVLALGAIFNYPLMGVLSMGGIAAGFLKNRGKKMVAAGFVFGVVLSALYLDAYLLNLYLAFSLAAGLVLFMAVPDNFSIAIKNIVPGSAAEDASQVKTLIEQRLLSVCATFKNMGHTLSSNSVKRQSLTRHELFRIIDDAVEYACEGCPGKDECWGRNSHKMYQASLRILESCEAGNEPYLADYDGPCGYISYFSGWISRRYDVYKLNLNWQNRMDENRQLMSQQFMGVSEIIEELLHEIKQREIVKSEFSEKIVSKFAKKNIEVRDVIILENAHGKFSVSLERGSCESKSNCFREATRIISNCLGRRMTLNKKTCHKNSGLHAQCRLNFIEEPLFRIHSGAAYAKKDGSTYSGDCHSVMEIHGSQAILALSDGMGSGQKARAESEAAMGLLKDFLEAGFSKELALKLINSVLILKDGSEHFSTMDICAIDMYTGDAQFVKFGAVSTFIKRGDSVSQIASESLPMGILTEVDAEVCKRNVMGGDIIVMITDGVFDSGDSEDGSDFERNWVAEALEEIDISDPQDIADYLIELAMRRSENVVKDDMTVLCARVRGKSA